MFSAVLTHASSHTNVAPRALTNVRGRTAVLAGMMIVFFVFSPGSSRRGWLLIPEPDMQEAVGRFRPLKKFGKFGIFSKLSKLFNFPRSTMSVLVHFHVPPCRCLSISTLWKVVVSHIQRIGCQPEKNYFTRWPIPLVVC